jgi:hypothetical protein
VEAAQDFINRTAAFPLDASGVETGENRRKLRLEFCPQDGRRLQFQEKQLTASNGSGQPVLEWRIITEDLD